LQWTKKLRDQPVRAAGGGHGGGDVGGGGGGGGGASQKQTFLESRHPVSRVSRYWFDTYQL